MRAATEENVAIRAATADDMRFIRQLSALAFDEYDPDAARTTAAMMRTPGASALVAQRSRKPLGFIVLRRGGSDVLAIDAIAVDPHERGKRIGKRLMGAAERFARAHGIFRITLSTAQSNLAALDLFLRLGFVIESRQAARYFRGQPACKLEKRLR